ncbi:type I polyketide synthase [Micractinium conductrix]|uniref:Type I polyketide synthase n=1 Tax=Micractinium conductrix TaxID=554055 RepID=A0A2P6UZE4_9CHLO|nr:type I polyketide synthase [Micractinium conductrix]|eukprot:PSC67203.1 type I polyketide synthase [Micractinium conductrix]
MAEYLAGLLPAPGKQRRKAHAQLQPVAAGSSGSGARSSATVPVAAVPAPEAALIDSRHKLELATAKVRAAVTKVLGGVEVAASTPLMTAGLDSLGALDLRKELSGVFGVDLPATLMFDYPTIETMAEELAGHASNVALDLTPKEAAASE